MVAHQTTIQPSISELFSQHLILQTAVSFPGNRGQDNGKVLILRTRTARTEMY